MRSTSIVVALFLLSLPTVIDARAQITDLTRSRYSPAAYYNYAEPGDVTVLVNVWGTVKNPGLYEVPSGSKLSTLFSLAGGPSIAVRRKRTKRTVSARLTRGNAQSIVLERVMENEIYALDPDPVLEDGDVLAVQIVEQVGFSWRDAFPIIAAVASVALAVERISSK